jgi:hypothetical protein
MWKSKTVSFFLLFIIITVLILDIWLILNHFSDYRERDVVVQKGAFTANFSENKAMSGDYVASKSGKNYYLVGCSGVKRIKEENKVYFDTKEEAEKKGLLPSKTCSQLFK